MFHIQLSIPTGIFSGGHLSFTILVLLTIEICGRCSVARTDLGVISHILDQSTDSSSDPLPHSSRVRGISMEIIKRRLDRGLYTRLDVFQEDMFAVFDRARRLSRPDSQTFEDAGEMQMFFISYR